MIYDAIKSPVLFTRGSDANTEPRRAIPVEYVRAVIEVKATLTLAMAKKVVDKLLKLQHYSGLNGDDDYPQFLCSPFVCAAVFFLNHTWKRSTNIDGHSTIQPHSTKTIQ